MFSRERYPQKSLELRVLETSSLTNLSSSRTTAATVKETL